MAEGWSPPVRQSSGEGREALMNSLVTRLVGMVGWRVVAVLALTVGVLGMQSGRGTLAYFTDSKTNSGNTFTAGTLNIQSSALPGATFNWDTSATNPACGSLTNGSATPTAAQ